MTEPHTLMKRSLPMASWGSDRIHQKSLYSSPIVVKLLLLGFSNLPVRRFCPSFASSHRCLAGEIVRGNYIRKPRSILCSSVARLPADWSAHFRWACGAKSTYASRTVRGSGVVSEEDISTRSISATCCPVGRRNSWTWTGWRLHTWRGGLAAGLLYVIPGAGNSCAVDALRGPSEPRLVPSAVPRREGSYARNRGASIVADCRPRARYEVEAGIGGCGLRPACLPAGLRRKVVGRKSSWSRGA